MAASFSTGRLPPLINGRRYSHELENPKPIPEPFRSPALKALHNYHTAVSLSERTLSEASGTSAPARSEASTGTSITEMTFAFSADNGSVQAEAARRRLPDVQRARKALMRKLQACLEDCRIRKVKCQLWHHALRDLLEIEHSAYDEMVVEWAIRYDADSQTALATSPVSARVTVFAEGGDIEARDDVIHQANNAFGLSSGTPMPYSPDIHESDASLLGNSESVSPPPFVREDTVVPDVSVPSIYSTFRDELMFPLGSRETMIEPAHYGCWFPGCVQILPMQDLISHFGYHLRFQRLADPLRMVCPVCDKFYAYSNDQCLACYTPTQSGGLVEKLYGRYFPDATTMGLQRETTTIHSDFQSLWSSDNPSPSWSSNQDSSPYPQNNSYGCSSYYPYGSSGSPGGSWLSRASSFPAQCKRNLFSSPILSRRLFRFVLRHRRYVAVLLLAASMSLIIGYKEHKWIVSTIAQLTYGVPTVPTSQLPFIGMVVASIAFALHRFVVRASHIGGIRTGWLSRCALNIFNVTCGRRRPEWPGATANALGHSRS